MSRRLMIMYLATACLWGTLVLRTACAQAQGGYAQLMDQAAQSSKPDAARLLYAQAVEANADKAAHETAALLLVMTFEKEGVLQEAECRAWAGERFADARRREMVEQAIQRYRQKFTGQAAPQDQAGEDQLEETDAAVSAALPLQGNVEELQRKTEVAAYDQLMLSGEELLRIGNLFDARRTFARALSTEPDSQILSRAATAIVLSFKEGGALNAIACRRWAKANIPAAEGRQRIELAIGESYYRSQEYDRAIAQLEGIASQKGIIADSASMVIALCLVGKGEQDAALARLERVAAESPVDEVAAKALFLIGWAQLQTQQYAPARAAFDRLAAKYPQSPFAAKALEMSERLKSYEKK